MAWHQPLVATGFSWPPKWLMWQRGESWPAGGWRIMARESIEIGSAIMASAYQQANRALAAAGNGCINASWRG